MSRKKTKNELIKELRDQNRQLTDEVESLWTMLDEIKESEIKNWGEILSQIKVKVATRALMTAKKKADC
jgi:hypothetical protein|tara:strand:- start:54 stop:260 length:207 start_codon:yes stop_codon:yes gene_type:complete